MSTPPTIDSKNVMAHFEAGKKKLDELIQRHTRMHVEFEASRRQFNEGSQEAEKEFGTSKLPELRELFRTREAKKIQDVFEFVMAVEELEAELKEIEAKAA